MWTPPIISIPPTRGRILHFCLSNVLLGKAIEITNCGVVDSDPDLVVASPKRKRLLWNKQSTQKPRTCHTEGL